VQGSSVRCVDQHDGGLRRVRLPEGHAVWRARATDGDPAPASGRSRRAWRWALGCASSPQRSCPRSRSSWPTSSLL
jgi:hypothetical protein